MWQVEIEAADMPAAHAEAYRRLQAEVEGGEACPCERHEQSGSNRWWISVAISLWPRDAAAMAAWLADGGDVECDPYELIPSELKRTDEAAA